MSAVALWQWAQGAGIGVAVWVAAWILGRILVARLTRLLIHTTTDVDDMLLEALRPQVAAWAVILGVVIAAQQVPLAESTRQGVLRLGGAAFVLSITLAISRFLSQMVARKAADWPGTLPPTTLTRNLIHVAVVGLGLLVVAGNLGIAITPILTALGVGSLAVALALQPTLANLFAGFHVTLGRQIRIGDFVELEDGRQGIVQDIGWRSTQIRELPNNLIIVPNARLAEIVIKNYSLPVPEQAALVQVGVAYGSSLERVEAVTLDVARGTLREVEGGVPDFEPLIRYHTFGDSSINFTVVLRVRQFVDRYLVIHEFMKRLHRRYAEDGIEIPFPQRVVHGPPPAGGD